MNAPLNIVFFSVHLCSLSLAKVVEKHDITIKLVFPSLYTVFLRVKVNFTNQKTELFHCGSDKSKQSEFSTATLILPPLLLSSWELSRLRADRGWLEKAGQSGEASPPPRCCRGLLRGLSTDEEPSCFIRKTAAYDIGRAATALAKSRKRRSQTAQSHIYSHFYSDIEVWFIKHESNANASLFKNNTILHYTTENSAIAVFLSPSSVQ